MRADDERVERHKSTNFSPSGRYLTMQPDDETLVAGCLEGDDAAFEALVGRQVAAVVNFPPKQIGKFLSEVLVLGFPDADGAVVLIAPDRPVPDGGKLF